MNMDKYCKKLFKEMNAARRFPVNTTPASRHIEIIAEALARKETYHMLSEEPEHCAGSMLAVLVDLYKNKNEIERLRNNS